MNRNLYALAAALMTAALMGLGGVSADPSASAPKAVRAGMMDIPSFAPAKPQYGWAGPKVVRGASISKNAPPARPDGSFVLPYREAHGLATAERRPLVVLAGPQAAALAEAVAADPDAVVALGDPATFPSGGVYRYRWDEARGELVTVASALPTVSLPVVRSGPVRYRCSGGVCTPY